MEKVNSFLRVLINPSIILFGFLFFDMSSFGGFAKDYSLLMILSYVLDFGLSLYVMSNFKTENIINFRVYVVFLLLSLFGIGFFLGVVVAFSALFFSLGYLFSILMRKHGFITGEFLSHVSFFLSCLIMFYVFSYNDIGYEFYLFFISTLRLIYPFVYLIYVRIKNVNFFSFFDFNKMSFLSVYQLTPYWLQVLSASLFSNLDTVLISFVLPLEQVGTYKIFVTGVSLLLIPLEVFSNYYIQRLVKEEDLKSRNNIKILVRKFLNIIV